MLRFLRFSLGLIEVVLEEEAPDWIQIERKGKDDSFCGQLSSVFARNSAENLRTVCHKLCYAMVIVNMSKGVITRLGIEKRIYQ